MANEIDIIASKNALAGLEDLIKKLDVADRLLIKAAQDALTLSQNVSKVTSPSGLSGNTSNNNNTTANVQRESQQTKVLANEINNLTKAKNNLNKATVQERVDAQIALNNAKQQARLVSEQADAYQKLSTRLLISQRNAQNLGATYGSTSKQFQKATIEVQKLDKELKDIDAGIGKHTRSVGNYASGWNGLGNSINQLTREAPAFAVSLNTGFLALSNNLPILSDEISKLIAVNKELIAQGQPVKSVFSQILGSIFSFQTALSVGVLLLTLYGGKITEWIGNLMSGSKAIDALKESQKQLNEISLEGQKNAVEETLKVKTLLSVAKDTTLTYKERMIAVKELQETYPAYFENLSKEQILAGDTAKAEKDLTDAILSRAKANAATSKITENQSKIIDLEEKRLALQKDLTEAQRQNNAAVSQATSNNGRNEGAALRSLQTNKNISLVRSEIAETEKQIAGLTELNNRLTSYAIERQKESILLDYKSEKAQKTKQEKKEDLEYFESYIEARGTLNQELDKTIEKLETEAILNRGNAELYPLTISLLNQMVKVRKDLNDLPTANVKILGVPEAKEQLKTLSEEAKKFAKTFTDEFANNVGFKETFMILRDEMKGFGEDWKTTFLGVAEIAQETFNFVTQLTTKNFDNEKQRLQDQYDVALSYAGDNKEAQEKLAEDLEAKKREISTREAKAKKKQALVNIAIDTAQAIVGLWANPGFPAAIPLALLVGGLGLAQAAIISSQEIPQYWMGGEHDGGKMMINDGAGSNWKETFVTPDGKAHQATSKNAIVDAPKGTKIYTHDQWLEHQREVSLNNMLSSNNIDRYIPVAQQKGMTKDDFYEVMGNTLGRQTIERSNLDANGFSKYTIKKGKSITRSLNRANGKA